MSRRLLVVTHDGDFAESARNAAERAGNCESLLCDDWTSVTDVLTDERCTHLLIDVRAFDGTEDLCGRFDLSAGEERPPLSLLTATNGVVPRNLALAIETFSAGRLELPLDENELVGMLTQPERVAATPHPVGRTVEAGGIRFTTYTPGLFSVLDQLQRVAVHEVTLLLVGETGTGKTTLAKLIHRLSPRRARPFQHVACGALPRDLIESELFGHVRGAFTGADRSKIGRFEAAGAGTLLLDEIDVLGPGEQAKLLRVIETGEFELVGATETRTSEARLIVAANVDLEELTARNRFRSDLYYRLNVLQFRLPPLRERPSDIVPMALQFVDECCREHGIAVREIDREFFAVLRSHDWPGNIRELRNQVQRAVLFCDDGRLVPGHLSPALQQAYRERGPQPLPAFARQATSLAERIALSEREILEEALQAHGYKRTATAKALGISRVGLYKKMRKYGMLETNGR